MVGPSMDPSGRLPIRGRGVNLNSALARANRMQAQREAAATAERIPWYTLGETERDALAGLYILHQGGDAYIRHLQAIWNHRERATRDPFEDEGPNPEPGAEDDQGAGEQWGN